MKVKKFLDRTAQDETPSEPADHTGAYWKKMTSGKRNAKKNKILEKMKKDHEKKSQIPASNVIGDANE